MLTALQAQTDLRGYSIRLDWTWVDPGPRPELVLLRRTRAYPIYSGSVIKQKTLRLSGLQVVDLQQLFGVTDKWARIDRQICLARNSEVESNLPLAEFSQYFHGGTRVQAGQTILPYEIRIGYTDAADADIYHTVTLSDITTVNYQESATLSWFSIKSWEIFHLPGGGGPAGLAGTVSLYHQHQDAVTPDRFVWQPATGTSITLDFEQPAQQLTEVELDETTNHDTGDTQYRCRVADHALRGEEIYYYRLYLKHDNDDFFSTQYHWRTAAVASADHNFREQLYRQLPAIHQYYDEPESNQRGEGQLRRYLSLAGDLLNHNRSLAEVLRNRHDSHRVYSNALPGLARMLGWQPDTSSDTLLLRKDIADAPEIYRTVGTIANLRAVVNRITGWDCKIKEFVHNVFLTNAVEPISLWEVWHRQFDGSSWSAPQQTTKTEQMDGHPRAVINDSGATWLFWHSNRDGNRGLWRQEQGSGGQVAEPLKLYIALEREVETYIEEYPALIQDGDRTWLFWASDRHGSWNIWGSWSRSVIPFSTGPDGSSSGDGPPPINQPHPLKLSDHPADDRHPAVVRDQAGNLWLFWQSNRRGTTDIWYRRYDGNSWSGEQRLTSATFRHLAPAATTDDAGRIWLFYCDDRADRININTMIHDSGSWAGPFAVTTGLHRDEAPCAAFYNGQMRLFWHSNRNNKWQLLGQVISWDGNQAQAVADPELITDEVTEDKEPYVHVDNSNNLHLYWRSQRRGRDYRSRTIDTSNPTMLSQLRSFEDHSHYSYDTGRQDNDYYARDAVGIFLTPNPDKPDFDDRNRRLMDGPLKEFIPINIRPVMFILPEVYQEPVYTYEFPSAEPQRLIGEEYSRHATRVNDETYSGLSEEYSDTVPDWTWLRTWSPTITDHRTVDTTTIPPVDIHFRTWHTGVSEGV